MDSNAGITLGFNAIQRQEMSGQRFFKIQIYIVYFTTFKCFNSLRKDLNLFFYFH